MKHIISLLAASLAAVCAWAQADTVAWMKTVHDFGAFSEDMHTVSTTFRWVNGTPEPVQVLSVNSSCGCTIADYDDGIVAPGDTGVVTVRYNAVGRPGRFVKNVYVRTSASPARTKLSIKGVVIGNSGSLDRRYPVEMGPLRLRTGAAMIGSVTNKQGKTETVEAYNQSGDSLFIKFSDVPRYVSVTAPPIAPGDFGAITFYYRGDMVGDWGIISDSITIIPTPQGAEYTLPVVAVVEEDFSALTPQQRAQAPSLSVVGDRVDLGIVPSGPGKPVTAKMQLLNRGEQPLLVRKAYSHDPAVQVRVSKQSIKSGKTADLIVTFLPDVQPQGIINAKVTLITNDPSQPTRSLRVVGTR